MADFATDIRLKAGQQLQLSGGSFTGSYVAIGTLLHEPVIMTFQNDSNQTVTISDDGTTDWKPFIPGERMVLDLTANHGIANKRAFPNGTKFYANAAMGTGSFTISYLYAR